MILYLHLVEGMGTSIFLVSMNQCENEPAVTHHMPPSSVTQLCKYPHQEEYWREFVSWKLSYEAKEQNDANMINSHKNRIPHRTGWRGCMRKILEWEEEVE